MRHGYGLAGVVRGLWLATATAIAGPLDSRIASLIGRTDLGNATVAVHAIDLDTGAEIAAYNPDLGSIPASNMKLLTAGAALAVLGPDFAFRTEILLDRSVSPPRLIVVGSGDPALGDPVLLEREEVGLSVDRLFDQIATALKAQGVERVSEIVIDDRVFDRDFVHPTWPTDQLNRWYCAELGGLNFHRNVVTVYTEPTTDNGSPLTTLVPDAPWIELANRARTDRSGSNTAWVSRPQPSDSMTLLGRIRTRTEIQVAVHNPPMYAGRIVANELSRRGIKAPDRWAHDHVRLANELEVFDQAKPVIVITTPLSDILRRINTDSHNLYAECVLKRIGHQITGEPGSWANGGAVVRMVLSDALGHERAESTNIADGSGMSRGNLVRPSTLTAWMRWLSRDQARWDAFLASLPAPGEGTLRSRFGSVDLSTEVVAKSGYIRGVYALSGIITDPDSGRRVAFSILLNEVPAGVQSRNARPLHEQIVSEIDRWMVPNRAARPANLGG
ncbi:MAG: D-alanyl-D-alanine carboxypeptidase/D-alanyl-D-alanine-endopeptidase [Phycisphaerales bacterium]|nr:D-alanyl-D-alanine carboxypeptidase/D-alanyl-D-alanine-endopeptidase [Phycisphaerales bacterium]